MAANRVLLKGDPRKDEALADAAGILPGYLVERTATGVQAHGTADGDAQPLFADVNHIIGGDVDDAYANGDTVQLLACKTGDQVWAWLQDGETASVGSELVSNGDGTLKVNAAAAGATESEAIVAKALEALSPSGADGQIKVEVI